MRSHHRLPVGVIAALLGVALVTMGAAYGLWSKNLVVSGTVETGDLNADWVIASSSDRQGSVDACEVFNPECGTFPLKDVGRLECKIDDLDAQIIHFTVFNGYPSYEADCEVHVKNTGTIPWNLIGFAIDPDASLTGCTIVDQGADHLEIECDQLTIKFVDNVGLQFDPGDERASSLLVHVEQQAEQSTPTNTVSYGFQLKLCVAQWNEATDFVGCYESLQHEGPPFVDNGGSAPFVKE